MTNIMQTTVVIAIGHSDRTGRPLHGLTVQEFSIAVEGALKSAEATVLSVTTGAGSWEQQVERSTVWIATTDKPRILKWDLELIAQQFDQTAIGYVVHDHEGFGDSLAYSGIKGS